MKPAKPTPLRRRICQWLVDQSVRGRIPWEVTLRIRRAISGGDHKDHGFERIKKAQKSPYLH